MSDESKAIEEVAKTTGKAIDAGREVGSFLSRYVGGSIEQLTGMAEDKLKYIRWERQIRLFERANLFLSERGIKNPTRKIPLQIAIPLIQAGSLEEEDSLQDRWGILLANAADAANKTEIRRAFISILEEMTPLDAVIFEKIYRATLDRVSEDKAEVVTVTTGYLPERAEISSDKSPLPPPSPDVEVSLGNLSRLGLVSSAMIFSGGFEGVYRTALGREFLNAISDSKNLSTVESN